MIWGLARKRLFHCSFTAFLSSKSSDSMKFLCKLIFCYRFLPGVHYWSRQCGAMYRADCPVSWPCNSSRRPAHPADRCQWSSSRWLCGGSRGLSVNGNPPICLIYVLTYLYWIDFDPYSTVLQEFSSVLQDSTCSILLFPTHFVLFLFVFARMYDTRWNNFIIDFCT